MQVRAGRLSGGTDAADSLTCEDSLAAVDADP